MSAHGRLVGYARVSTDDQATTGQRQALKDAGCALVYEDVGSGAKRSREQLERCLEAVREGDTLVVTKLDRLARSVVDLFQILDLLKRRGVGFRSLRETFDTTTSSGRLMLGLLALIAEFERSLINERVRAGIEAAKARGVRFGNPAFMEGEPTAIALMRASQADTYERRAIAQSRPWIGIVRAHRPALSWEAVANIINAKHRDAGLTVGRLRRIAGRLVASGDLPASILERSTGAPQDAGGVARALRAQNPDISLRQIATELDRLGIGPPRARAWSAQTVKRLLEPLDADPTVGEVDETRQETGEP